MRERRVLEEEDERVEHGAVQRSDLHAAVKERGETDRRAHTSQATRLCYLFSYNNFHLSIFTFTKGLPIELFLSFSSNPERLRKPYINQIKLPAVTSFFVTSQTTMSSYLSK